MMNSTHGSEAEATLGLAVSLRKSKQEDATSFPSSGPCESKGRKRKNSRKKFDEQLEMSEEDYEPDERPRRRRKA